MKTLSLIALLSIFNLQAKAQIQDTVGLSIPHQDGKIVYEKIVEGQGKSKTDLYSNAQQWFVDFFKSSKDVIQNQDKDQGLIIGKGILIFSANAGLGMKKNYTDKLTIKVVCKDNKFRYTIYDMRITVPNYEEETGTALENFEGKLIGTAKMPISKGVTRSVIQNNDNEIKELIKSLIVAMNKKSDSF